MTAIARRGFLAGLLCVGAGPALSNPGPSPAARAAFSNRVPVPGASDLPTLSETVVRHGPAGIAIHGFDPVAYFLPGRPLGGRAEHELNDGVAVWRFASASNRAAFVADPEVYRPLFGAYDPVAVANGRAAETSPEHFLVSDGRLLLFRSADSRAEFAKRPELMAEAIRNWPSVERQLAR